MPRPVSKRQARQESEFQHRGPWLPLQPRSAFLLLPLSPAKHTPRFRALNMQFLEPHFPRICTWLAPPPSPASQRAAPSRSRGTLRSPPFQAIVFSVCASVGQSPLPLLTGTLRAVEEVFLFYAQHRALGLA